MFVVGRGAEFATAREIALKLLETCRIAAEPLTATDLAHGPVAALDSLFPVWAIASDDANAPRRGRGGRARTRGRRDDRREWERGGVDSATREYVLPSPPVPSPLLAPLLSIVPGQLFAAGRSLAHEDSTPMRLAASRR